MLGCRLLAPAHTCPHLASSAAVAAFAQPLLALKTEHPGVPGPYATSLHTCVTLTQTPEAMMAALLLLACCGSLNTSCLHTGDDALGQPNNQHTTWKPMEARWNSP